MIHLQSMFLMHNSQRISRNIVTKAFKSPAKSFVAFTLNKTLEPCAGVDDTRLDTGRAIWLNWSEDEQFAGSVRAIPSRGPGQSCVTLSCPE